MRSGGKGNSEIPAMMVICCASSGGSFPMRVSATSGAVFLSFAICLPAATFSVGPQFFTVH
jgi:hypothetical protein